MANQKNTTDFMVSGQLSYCGLNTPRKSKLSDDSRYITILNPIISNPWKMEEEEFNKASKELTDKMKDDPDSDGNYIVIGVKGNYPIRQIFDKAINKPVDLPQEADENGELKFKEPIDTPVDINVRYLYSDKYAKMFFTFGGMQVPDASKLEFYERSSTGMFGADAE